VKGSLKKVRQCGLPNLSKNRSSVSCRLKRRGHELKKTVLCGTRGFRREGRGKNGAFGLGKLLKRGDEKNKGHSRGQSCRKRERGADPLYEGAGKSSGPEACKRMRIWKREKGNLENNSSVKLCLLKMNHSWEQIRRRSFALLRERAREG